MIFTSLVSLPELRNSPPFLRSLSATVVPVIPTTGSRPRNCILNVKKYIEENGGREQYGWMFSSLGNVAIRFVGHCVVRTDAGSLICVTPHEQRAVTKIGFLIDSTIEPTLQGMQRLPTHTEALMKSPVAEEYAMLDNAQHEIRNRYPSRFTLNDERLGIDLSEKDSEKMTSIAIRLMEILPQVESLVARTHQVNQLCYCGSGNKYKKCCRQNKA